MKFKNEVKILEWNIFFVVLFEWNFISLHRPKVRRSFVCWSSLALLAICSAFMQLFLCLSFPLLISSASNCPLLPQPPSSLPSPNSEASQVGDDPPQFVSPQPLSFLRCAKFPAWRFTHFPHLFLFCCCLFQPSVLLLKRCIREVLICFYTKLPAVIMFRRSGAFGAKFWAFWVTSLWERMKQ